MSTAGSNRRGFWIKAGLGLAITLFLLLFLLRYIDVEQIGKLLVSIRWSLYLVGLMVWGMMYLVRAVRFVILAPRTPYLTMLSITAVHNFLLRVFPMRTGDLSYAFLIKRTGTAGLGESLLGLLLLRILDATAVVVIFCMALAIHPGIFLGDRELGILLATGIGLVGIAGVVCLERLFRVALAGARGLTGWIGLAQRPKVQSLLSRADRSVDSFSKVGNRGIFKASAVTGVLWLLTFSAFFVIMRAFLIPVGISQTVLGATAAVVTGFLPIGGIGSFGTMEAGWALGFALVGLPQQIAIASGFGVSLTTFSYSVILGLLGWIGLTIIGKKSNTRTSQID